MNATDRTAALRRAILSELSSCGGHLVPERAIVNAMYAISEPAPTKLDVRNALQWLLDSDFVVSVNPTMSGSVKWRITDNGEAALHA